MNELTERLDALRALIQSHGFLTGDGLSNEVNIRIFCYAAKDEMPVQHFIRQLVTDQTLACHLIECNLYQTFLSICEDMGIQDEISVLEDWKPLRFCKSALFKSFRSFSDGNVQASNP